MISPGQSLDLALERPVVRDGKVLPCGIYGRWEAAGAASLS